ncbi:MAG: gamma carbonic anhydrase family protein, partial [Blastocatellia bacterium]
GRFPTVIGDCVTIGHGVMLHGCTIEGHSLIGIGAIVLDNATVGEYSIVAAGSVVPPGAIIPPRSLAIRSPAKVRREVNATEIERIDANWKNYLEYKIAYMAEDSAEH